MAALPRHFQPMAARRPEARSAFPVGENSPRRGRDMRKWPTAQKSDVREPALENYGILPLVSVLMRQRSLSAVTYKTLPSLPQAQFAVGTPVAIVPR